jgi:dephospho-CoA kinase
MPYILGLTGNIASGKTTVGLLLLELGAAEYVDADTVVHQLYLPGQPLVAELAREFGPGIIDAEGGVDRKALGDLVFNDPARLRRLEQIVHPQVFSALSGRMRDIPENGVGVLDAVKLVESGYGALCHALWIVTCPPQIQLERLMATRGMTEADARARLAAQPPIEPKLGLASAVIDNSGTVEDLRRQVTAAWNAFLASLPRS